MLFGLRKLRQIRRRDNFPPVATLFQLNEICLLEGLF